MVLGSPTGGSQGGASLIVNYQCESIVETGQNVENVTGRRKTVSLRTSVHAGVAIPLSFRALIGTTPL